MANESPTSENALFDLASLRADHRSLTRRQVITSVFMRTSRTWKAVLILAVLALPGLPTIACIYFGSPGTYSEWFGLSFTAAVFVFLILLHLAAADALKDVFKIDKRAFVEPDFRLRGLRYLLFREATQARCPLPPERVRSLQEIEQTRRELDRYAIFQHPIHLVLMFTVLLVINSAAGQYLSWPTSTNPNAIGPVLAVYVGAFLVCWLMGRRFIAALFLTPGYREREFGLFLKLLATDTQPTV